MMTNRCDVFHERMKVRLIRTYIIRPAKVIIRNSSLLFMIVVLLSLDRYSNTFNLSINTNQILSSQWLFGSAPHLIKYYLRENWKLSFIILIVAGFKAYLLVIVFSDFKLIYQKERVSLLGTLHSVRQKNVLWCFIWNSFVTITYFGLIMILYFVGLFFWMNFKFSLLIINLAVIIIVFPLFYAMLSIGGKMSVMPFPWAKRFFMMLSIINERRIKKVYTFYILRLFVEAICYFLVPVLLVSYIPNFLLRLMIIIPIILAPLILLRASTYEFFLSLYRDEPDFQLLFKDHYSQNPF